MGQGAHTKGQGPVKSQNEGQRRARRKAQDTKDWARAMGRTPRPRIKGDVETLGKSQKEDQGEVTELRPPPQAVLRSPGPPGLPLGSSLGSLQTSSLYILSKHGCTLSSWVHMAMAPTQGQN